MRQIKRLIQGLLLVALTLPVIAFVLVNSQSVSINLFVDTADLSLGVALIAAFIIGSVLGLSVALLSTKGSSVKKTLKIDA